jgi:hypothetical protein
MKDFSSTTPMNVIDAVAEKVLEFKMISIFSPYWAHIVHLFNQFPHKQFYDDFDEFCQRFRPAKPGFADDQTDFR